jgi:Ca2+-binding EF-hand superfamily protein
MDRDNSGTITRKELDCEEMRTVLRMILLPEDDSTHAHGGGASYSRTAMNHDQALTFCLRKADINNDGTLSFEEFKCFTWELRQITTGKDMAALVFALFDLDSDQILTQDEFHEIYRFYLGHHPKHTDFMEQWDSLYNGDGESHGVTKDRYMKWLQTTASPIFRQNLTQAKNDAEAVGKIKSFAEMSRDARRVKKDADGWPVGPRKDIKARPKWNQKWNWQINPNDDLPYGERIYFSRSQSLPQLKQFLSNHAGCEKQHQTLTSRPPPRRLKVVSTDTTDHVMSDPARHLPGGHMREHGSGETVLWEDRWQTPLRFRRRFRVADRPLAPHSVLEASHQHIGPMAPLLNRLHG